MARKNVFAFAVVGLLLAAHVRADTIVANVNGVQSWTPVTVTLWSGPDNTGTKLLNGSTEYATSISLTRTGGDHVGIPTIGTTFNTFCVELTQSVYVPSSGNVFTVRPLGDAPVPNPVGNVIPAGGMGATRATLIEELWYRHFGDTLGNAANAAAFQVAIWAIVYDSRNLDANDPLQVSAGTVKTQAASWLGQLVSDQAGKIQGQDYQLAGLAALTGGGIQDQVAEIPGYAPTSAPLPGIAAAGFGILSLLAVKRNRKSQIA